MLCAASLGLFADAETDRQKHPHGVLAASSQTGRSHTLGRTEWCPNVCQHSSVSELLLRANLTWPWELTPADDRLDVAGCDLCETKWLSVVSMSGRTGSSSVLHMLNAHPAITLAGEANAELRTARDFWEKAVLSQRMAAGSGWAHGRLRPRQLLCDLQKLMLHASVPADEGTFAGAPSSLIASYETHQTVRGIKEIWWGPEDLQFLQAVFPCNRLVINDRLGHVQTKEGFFKASTKSMNEWVKTLPGWQKWWINLQPDGFKLDAFNDFLAFIGEPPDGCRFSGVVHANFANETSSSKSEAAGYSNADEDRLAALELLHPETCKLMVEVRADPKV